MAAAEARWEVLYEQLRAQIESGELAPGARLPSERELTTVEGVSRDTVRRALARLEHAGLVQAGPGKTGRVVRERTRIELDMSRFEFEQHVGDPDRGLDQWQVGVRNAGWTPREVVAGVVGLPAPDEVADLLAVEAGEVLIRRRRLRYVSKTVAAVPEVLAMVADTWTPLDIAQTKVGGVAPLLSPTDLLLPGGIYEALGFHQVRFLDAIAVRMPTPEEVELMELPPGTPVGQHTRVGLDADGRRVRALIQIWAGDRQIITYNLPVPRPDSDS